MTDALVVLVAKGEESMIRLSRSYPSPRYEGKFRKEILCDGTLHGLSS